MSKITVSELDFDAIKSNLKTFMQGQEQFSDYDFEGSSLNVLLDILAYNTHYNALYTNMAVNEMFLDSASKRESIISIANNFGYLPNSKKSSTAKISLTVPVGSSNALTLSLPKYSPFATSSNAENYKFYNTTERIGTKVGSNFVFSEFPIYEGSPVVERFTVFQSDAFIQLNNLDIDTASIKVTVQDTNESLKTFVYKFADNILTLSPVSEVYFLKEVSGGRYQIYFGRNSLGKEPGIGSVVTVEYLTTSGADANGAKLFLYEGSGLGGIPSITLNSIAAAGQGAETNDQIKYNVSRKFQTQDRAVTSEDYITIVKSQYADIDSIVCWGGESMTPPVYGKIYMSIKPTSGDTMLASEKTYVIDSIIKPKSVLGMTVEIVDPSYIKLILESKVQFDPNVTNRTSAQIIELVNQTIEDYNNTNLKKFDGVFRLSNLSTSIDKSDTSIISNTTTVKLRKELDVVYSTAVQYTIKFVNPIEIAGFPEEYIKSNGFYVDSSEVIHYIDDDGVGNLRLFYKNVLNNEKVIKNATVGTVNYATGTLTINSLLVTGLVDRSLYITAKPQPGNVYSKFDNMVLIDLVNLSVGAQNV